MLKIHYFASIREQMGSEGQDYALGQNEQSVADLIAALQASEPKFAAIIEASKTLLVAVNQTVVERSYMLSDGDEVAFFPPMTGG